MPVVYRVKDLDDAAVKFFAKKGDATKARRASKKSSGVEAGELETLKVSSRDEFVALLNDPSGDGEEGDVPDSAKDLL